MRVVALDELCVCRYCGLHFSPLYELDTGDNSFLPLFDWNSDDNCYDCPEGCEAFLKSKAEDAAFVAEVWAEFDADQAKESLANG